MVSVVEIIVAAMTATCFLLDLHIVEECRKVICQIAGAPFSCLCSPAALSLSCVLCLVVSIKSWKLVYFFIQLWYVIVMIDYFLTDMYVYKVTCTNVYKWTGQNIVIPEA